MKTKFFWITVLALLFSSQAWSQYAPKNIQSGSSFERPGVDAEDKNFILKDAEQGLQEHKKENGGKINLTKFKPVAMQALYETFQAEEITRKELMEIRNAYQKLEKDSKNMDQAQIEKNLRAVFKKLFEKIQNTKLQCTAEGKQCNNWGCCKGLVCAAVPERARVQMNQCKRFRSECRQDSECCSGECVESYVDGPESVGLPGIEERNKSFKKAKKKVCAAVRRCFKPGKVGAACDRNPVCGEGQCLPVNRGILGINECSRSGNECSSNDQCCSNKCNRGKCVENFICKNCIGQGIRPKRGQKCCEGLYKDPDSKKCIREMPPFVLPQVKVLPMKKSIIALVASFFISEANAGDQQTRETETSRAKNAAENDTKLQQKLMMQQGGFGTIPGQLEKDAKYKDHELAQFDVREGSDFDKCEIDLKADYLIRLRDYGQDGNGIGGINNAIGMEMALMAFEYMLLGKGTEDYWLAEKNKSNTNIYQRMRKVAEDHRKNRHSIFKDLTEQSKRLQCLCWDKSGYTKLDEDTKERFRGQCPSEYQTYLDYRDSNPNMTDDDYSGDASGIKSQALMVRWLELVVEIEGAMSVQNDRVFEGLSDLAAWANGNDWGSNDLRKPKLYDWTMKTSGYQVEAGNYAHNWNMEQLAIIVAGVVGIVAGLASLTVWPGIWISFGVIFGGASLGGAGMYLVGAMKGAWESRAPLIQDKSTRAYKCGKKSYCTDFKREFHVPRTSICDSYMSGNGCLKKFLVENIDGKERFIVDPFIPLGVSKSKLIKDTTNYPTYFNRAFNKAKSSYSSRKPSGKQGKSYLNRIFIDSLHVGQMAPEFRTPMKKFYEVKESMRKLIKDNAMIYALDEGVFSSDIGRCDLMKDGTSESFSVTSSASSSSSTGSNNCLTFGGESAVGPDCNQSQPQTNEPVKSPTVVSGGACSNGTSPYKVDYLGKTWYFDSQKNASKMSSDINKLKNDLEKFADYAYDFHWVWPRLAQEGMIAYPMPGFISYLELISSTLGNKASINVGNVNDINNNLLAPQLQNMQVTCSKYVEAGNGTPTGTIEGDCDRMMGIRLEGQEIDKTQGNGLLDGLDDLQKDSVNFAGGFDLGAGNGADSGGNMAFMGNRNDSGSRGNLSGASLAGGADSGFRGAAKTKARLRKIRKMQLDKMKKFREAVGDARADQLLNAQKAMVSKFNNPTGKSVASLGSSGIGGILNGSGSGKKATSKSNRNDLVGSSGNGGGSGFSIPKPNYDLSYNTGGNSGSGSGMSREMSEAQDRLAEAVEYRDENPSDFDKNKDGDTLWKIITRSYIRNYDKLLRKRKKRIDPGL